MYPWALELHNLTRWLVLLSGAWAIQRGWQGVRRGREWTRQDRWVGLLFVFATSFQFVFGCFMLVYPHGFGGQVYYHFESAMRVPEVRFFGLLHPLAMFVAIWYVHMGSARARRAKTSAEKHRHAALCYTIAGLAMLAAIPWWRPMLRLP